MDSKNTREIGYRTVNIFAPERFIYFFADAPHLMKTARNCLSLSAPGVGKRYLWRDGKHLLWQHIANLYYTDLENGGKAVSKLSVDHIKLNSYSRMTVKFAAQVLSESVSINLKLWDKTEESSETAEYCGLMDKFFDCFNVRYKEGSKPSNGPKKTKKALKPWLKSYKSLDDERLFWLENTFLNYFKTWEKNVQNRPGKFTKTERARMFISRPTYEGLLISVYSLIEVIPYLLNQGFDYILSERFCQDILEEYFGDHRRKGGRADNPDVQTFGSQTAALMMQKKVTCHTGNTKGRHDHKKTWEVVSDEPLPKLKSKRKQQ